MKELSTHIPGGTRGPKIDYPCRWQYKIIAESRAEIRRVVEHHVQERPLTLADSNVSSGGRYVSMNLEVTVSSDAERLELYRVLANDPAIRVVL
ncbi:MAG: HP0495 family protein [Desulfobulbaceae bacterium]